MSSSGDTILIFSFVSLNFFGAGFRDVLGDGSFIIHNIVECYFTEVGYLKEWGRGR